MTNLNTRKHAAEFNQNIFGNNYLAQQALAPVGGNTVVLVDWRKKGDVVGRVG